MENPLLPLEHSDVLELGRTLTWDAFGISQLPSPLGSELSLQLFHHFADVLAEVRRRHRSVWGDPQVMRRRLLPEDEFGTYRVFSCPLVSAFPRAGGQPTHNPPHLAGPDISHPVGPPTVKSCEISLFFIQVDSESRRLVPLHQTDLRNHGDTCVRNLTTFKVNHFSNPADT